MTHLGKWVCMGCKHYWHNNRCVAFPAGIPKAIYSGENDHSKPVEGDNGIVFEEEERELDDSE